MVSLSIPSLPTFLTCARTERGHAAETRVVIVVVLFPLVLLRGRVAVAGHGAG